MKKAKTLRQTRAWIALLLLLGTVCLCSGCKKAPAELPAPEQEQSQKITLENYSLNVQVQSRHRMLVTETLTVNYEKKITGITRAIPYEGYRLDPVKNEKVPYRMTLDRVDVDTDYSMRRENGKAYLDFGGKSDQSAAGGTQIYTLKYRLSCYQDKDAAGDLFYCSLLPYDWENGIRAANITVTMPKDFEASGLTMYCYTDGSWSKSEAPYTVSGKNISAFLSEKEIEENPQLSMQIKLPEGYFKGEKSLVPMQVFFYTLMLLLTIGTLVLWWIFARPTQGTPAGVVRQHKLTPIEDAYLLRETLTMTDIAAFLTYWAENGVVRIVRLSAKEYSVTALNPPDKSAKSFEFTLYNALFGDGVMTHKTGAAAARIRGCLPKVKRQAARSCAAICCGRLYTLESVCVKYAALLFSVLPTLIVLSVGGNLVLDYSAGYVGLISSGVLLLTHAGILALHAAWRHAQKLTRILSAAILSILEAVTLIGVLHYGASGLGVRGWMAAAVAAAGLLLAVSLLSGRKSTGYQNQLSQLNAYKRYLKNVDSSDIIDGSAFYYSRLATAYVLRVGKIFSKKCDGYPLSPHNGMVFRGDEPKLAHAVGFYSYYLYFIHTLNAAEYTSPESEPKPVPEKAANPKTEAQKQEVSRQKSRQKSETKQKVSFWTQAVAVFVTFFHRIAVWINEGIDWLERKLKRQTSGTDEDADETDHDGNNED